MNFMNHMLHCVALAWLMMFTSACSSSAEEGSNNPISQSEARGPVTLTLTLQNDHITVGSPLTLQLQAVAEVGSNVHAPLVDVDAEESRLGIFNVLENEHLPDYPDDQGRRIWTQTLTLDTFQAGAHELPAMTVHFEDARGDIVIDGSVSTKPMQITVDSAITAGTAGNDAAELATTESSSLRDIRGPIHVPLFAWMLWIPVGAALLLIILGLMIWTWMRTRKKSHTPPVPPHVLARRQLDELEADALLEHRSFQPFYFRLADILRHYIEGQFGLLAPKKTTPEFLADLRTCAIFEQDQQHLLSNFMRCADMVKFALHQPPLKEGHEAMSMARAFVDDTEPVSERMEVQS
jgi:hypothetical protein